MDIDPKRPVKVMGIINLTPDSFYGPSRYNLSILDSGADIIDIGACSTRPGHTPVGPDEEWRRLEPVIWDIARHHPGHTISIDTYWSQVVRHVYEYLGPDFIVNDVSAGSVDPELLPTVAALRLPYIAMHGLSAHTSDASPTGRGHSPSETSVKASHSVSDQGQASISRRGDSSASPTLGHEWSEPGSDIVDEVEAFFEVFSAHLESLGIKDWYLDPGFGFGKTVQQNLALLEALPRLRSFGRPILVGISRKRMTWEHLGLSADEALPETSRLHMVALRNGADILRVHDVGAALKVIADYRG